MIKKIGSFLCGSGSPNLVSSLFFTFLVVLTPFFLLASFWKSGLTLGFFLITGLVLPSFQQFLYLAFMVSREGEKEYNKIFFPTPRAPRKFKCCGYIWKDETLDNLRKEVCKNGFGPY